MPRSRRRAHASIVSVGYYFQTVPWRGIAAPHCANLSIPCVEFSSPRTEMPPVKKQATLPSGEGKPQTTLDTKTAVELVMLAFDGLRELLEEKGLLASGDASSRRFLFRFITTRALASCVRDGAAKGVCKYAPVAALWSNQGKGKETLDVAGAFSRWVAVLPRATETGSAGNPEYRTSDEKGIYNIRAWFFRPSDRGKFAAAGLGCAGISVAIEKNGREVLIRADDRISIPDEYYRLPEALAADDEQLSAEIARVLANVAQALRELPVRIVRLLAKDPNGLMLKDAERWWDTLGRVARAGAAAVGTAVLGLVLMFCAAPRSVQRRIFGGISYAVRAVRWTADRPDIYYGPRKIDLMAVTKSPTFAALLPGMVARDPQTNSSVAVERVGNDPHWLRLRIESAPRFRTNRTKYYINFGDGNPHEGGFDVVTLGPAAVVEHRYPRDGTYALYVAVATDEFTPEQRKLVPADFQIDESWGWVQYAAVRAKIVVAP